MKRCPTCRERPAGPIRAGYTPSGGCFVFRACERCQRRVDRKLVKLAVQKWGDAVTPAQIARLTA
jgi:hypothetical protein